MLLLKSRIIRLTHFFFHHYNGILPCFKASLRENWIFLLLISTFFNTIIHRIETIFSPSCLSKQNNNSANKSIALGYNKTSASDRVSREYVYLFDVPFLLLREQATRLRSHEKLPISIWLTYSVVSDRIYHVLSKLLASFSGVQRRLGSREAYAIFSYKSEMDFTAGCGCPSGSFHEACLLFM